MIKSLFEHDENVKEAKAGDESVEEIAKAIEMGNSDPTAENVSFDNAGNSAETSRIEVIELPENAGFAKEIKQAEPIPTFQITEPAFENYAAEEESLLEVPDYEAELEAKINEIAARVAPARAERSIAENAQPLENIESLANRAGEAQAESILADKKEYAPAEPNFNFETQSETIRRTGLAFSAAITLFGAVAFMMIIGWFFDLICGTSPWGIVGGVAFGALIGFIQFFRQTSQIFGKSK